VIKGQSEKAKEKKIRMKVDFLAAKLENAAFRLS